MYHHRSYAGTKESELNWLFVRTLYGPDHTKVCLSIYSAIEGNNDHMRSTNEIACILKQQPTCYNVRNKYTHVRMCFLPGQKGSCTRDDNDWSTLKPVYAVK